MVVWIGNIDKLGQREGENRRQKTGVKSIAKWGWVAGLGVGHRRCVGRGLICCWGFDVVWLFHVHWGRFCGGVDRGLFIRDKGLEGQDLQQPKVGQEHGQQRLCFASRLPSRFCSRFPSWLRGRFCRTLLWSGFWAFISTSIINF